jgi:hypothetical protein
MSGWSSSLDLRTKRKNILVHCCTAVAEITSASTFLADVSIPIAKQCFFGVARANTTVSIVPTVSHFAAEQQVWSGANPMQINDRVHRDRLSVYVTTP